MKLKLIHILNSLDGEREISSIYSLSVLKDYGVDYTQLLTPLYTDTNFPKPLTNRPRTSGHYGLYLNYKKAIKENFSEDLDALIICECDCILNLLPENFLDEMKNTLDFCVKHDIYQFSWGSLISCGHKQNYVCDIDDDFINYCIVDRNILSHFIILPKQSREFFIDKIDNFGWDTTDIWLNFMINNNFSGCGKQACVFHKLAYQHEGYSLLDTKYIKGEKVTNEYFYETKKGWEEFRLYYKETYDKFVEFGYFDRIKLLNHLLREPIKMDLELKKSKKYEQV